MALLKCKMCGGELNISEGATVAECEYCGSKQTVPTADNEKKMTLFARANRLRFNCEFDKAAGVYESLVAEFPEEAEGYWGLVLCKYGIEYVDDPATGKKIPTCHRSSFDSVLKDKDFELAQEYADVIARRIYREEAKTIDEIRKSIVEVSAKEEPYDIFICYKETDFNGKRTLDSVLAQDIYDALTEKQYRVFFSRITLEDKLGTEYEPYIFAALHSAKIMLVIGTDYEYFNAVWVKNEWSRFLKLMATDREKHLVPCYKGIDAYDMPEEFARLQAQDLDKMGAIQDILRGVGKLLPKQPEPIKETVVVQQAGNNISVLLKRGNMALEDEEWGKARSFFEDVLNQDPEFAPAYLGLAMCDKKVCTAKTLVFFNDVFQLKNYQRAKQFADAVLLKELETLEVEKEAEAERERERARKAKEEAERERALAAEREARAKEEAERERILAAERAAKEREEAHRRRLAERRKACLAARGMAIGQTVNTVGINADGTLVVFGSDVHYMSRWEDVVTITGKFSHTVGLKSDGTVVAKSTMNEYGQCNVSDWKDIVAISAEHSYTIGLKADGTVVAVGKNDNGQCNVSGWKEIVAVAAGYSHAVGLKSDGTVVAAGNNQNGQCNVSDWKKIVSVFTGSGYTVGLKADGTAVAVGENGNGQCNVSDWKDIVDIQVGSTHTVGLKADGTVVAVGNNQHGQCNVSGWKDIVAIFVTSYHTAGLKADGTAVVVGDNQYGQCNVSGWLDIVAIDIGHHHTVGLKSDGTMVAAGTNYFGECNTSGCKLFDSFSNLAEERKEKTKARRIEIEKKKQEQRRREETMALRRQQGVCQICGGTFKGMISKKCSQCGWPKDY